MKTIKKILGYAIAILFFPVIFGLMTFDGKICYHGNCEDVIPFWGGFIIGVEVILVAGLMLGVAILVMKLIMD